MTAKQWINDDTGYEAWISSHAYGYVANMHNPLGGKYFLMHHTTHRLPDRSNPGSTNPRTGRDYTKVTADTLEELIEWARQNVPTAQPTRCKHCFPIDDQPINDAPTSDRVEYELRANRLKAKGDITQPTGSAKPESVTTITTAFLRDPRVRAFILQRANGVCELCGAQPFLTINDEPYLEVHHIVMLADGGADTPSNTAALCANCHRQLHYAKDRERLKEQLKDIIRAKDATARKSLHA